MNNDDKEMLRLYHQAMGQVEKISVETQISDRIEDQYKQAIESIGLNPEFVFSDDAKRIYVLKIVQDEKGQYKYRKSYIDYNSFTKNFDTLTKNNIKDYIAKNRYMVNPILVNRYGFYVRPKNWTGFELPDQEFTKEKVFIDIKKRIIYVYNAIPEAKTDFNVVGAFLLEILDRNEYKLFMQWLALYVFESRAGLRKPILIITGKFWYYIRDIWSNLN
ncbi:hypothetical protein MEO40_17695, partial [Dolichospermum sp. ST_sed1]|nr:hypothetical protein [Dolichospermum sp. ST_sed1]